MRNKANTSKSRLHKHMQHTVTNVSSQSTDGEKLIKMSLVRFWLRWINRCGTFHTDIILPCEEYSQGDIFQRRRPALASPRRRHCHGERPAVESPTVSTRIAWYHWLTAQTRADDCLSWSESSNGLATVHGTERIYSVSNAQPRGPTAGAMASCRHGNTQMPHTDVASFSIRFTEKLTKFLIYWILKKSMF